MVSLEIGGKVSMNIVQQLVQGSHHIDRMKSEVQEVIPTLFGFLKGGLEYGEKLQINEFFDFGITKWVVKGTICSNTILFEDDESITVECWVCDSSMKWLGFSSKRRIFFFNTTQDVYESLPRFIEAMFEKYPDLLKSCQPLIRAAEVFKS